MNFFDYTSLDDLVPHGLTLLEKTLPIILLGIVIFLIYRYQDQLRSYKHEKAVRITLGVMMLLGEIAYLVWNYIHSLDGAVRFVTVLPLHICSYAIWGFAFALFTKKEKIFNYLFIFGIISVLALLFPNVNHGFNSFRYYQLFYSHSLLMIALIYMYKVNGFYPSKKELINSFIMLQIIIVYSIILNVLVDGSFLFIGPGNKPIDFAWEWPWHMIEYEVVMLLVYYGFYRVLKKVKA